MAGGYLGNTGQVTWAESLYTYLVFQDPTWNYATMNVERDVAYADAHVGKLPNSGTRLMSRLLQGDGLIGERDELNVP